MTRHSLAWAAAGICSVVALGWLALLAEPAPEPGGLIRIAPGAAPPAGAAGPTAPPAAGARRIALVATQEDVDRAEHQSWLAAREKRDVAWAARSEAAIARQMRRIAYIGGKRRLEIKCAASICEVVGIADPDPATNAYAPVWEALERDTAGDELGAVGLTRTAAIFDTGRIPEEFRIQYRRVDPAPGSAGK